MTETLRIRVLQKHILKGIPESACSCPIAQAVREVSPRKKRVAVLLDEMQVGSKTYDLPRAVSNFIKRFDAGKSVKPTTFIERRQMPQILGRTW